MCLPASADTTLAEFSAPNVALVSSRKSGDKTLTLGLSFVNVNYILFYCHETSENLSLSTACNCHGHSNTCEYDESVDENSLSLDMHGNYEGGGVCKNCQHNTEGINCNKCRPTYYRPYGRYWNESQVCKRKFSLSVLNSGSLESIFGFVACDCDNFYSTGNCEEETGRCECKPEYQAPDCQSCSYGHFGFPNCRACECNMNGTNGYHCESTNGKCPCKNNFGGDYCKTCAEGYYGLPDCNACECNAVGSVNDVCDFTSGQCLCNSNFDGKQCDRCKNGYFNYPSCLCTLYNRNK